MSNRPPALCNLKTGKLIDTQNNFADTFNWMTSCIDNLQGGTGIKVEWPSTDTPQISLDSDYLGGAGSGGGGGGTGEVTITGTDGSSATGTSIEIVSAQDSNVVAHVTGSEGKVVVTLGVYWT